jgi:hypothetical protein
MSISLPVAQLNECETVRESAEFDHERRRNAQVGAMQSQF